MSPLDMTSTLQSASNAIWDPLAYAILILGLGYTIITKAVQFRSVPDMLRQLRASEGGEGGMSSFQALVMALASRVGVGSIAGVATAIAGGGPGALVWMALTGLVASTVGYAEATLSQTYKRQVDDPDRVAAKEDIGGMPWYIRWGIPNRPVAVTLATVVAVLGVVGYGALFPGFQVSTIASSWKVAFGLPGWVPATIMTILVGAVIIGGTTRIVHVSQVLVPVMAVLYLLFSIAVILTNASKIPAAIVLILKSSVGLAPMLSGMVGASIAWGVRRAVFASSDGLGEATFTAAAARTSHPGKQGLVQTFSIYIDVLLICMATGLMMVVSGTYNVADPSGAGFRVENLHGVGAGAQWVQAAIDTMIPGWGSVFVAISLLMFGFACLMLYYYVASSNLLFLLNGRKSPAANWTLKAAALVIVFVGSIVPATLVWALGDIGLGLISWVNVVSLALLFPIVRKVYRDYEQQRRRGLDPTFDPEEVGIANAGFWKRAD